MLIIIFQGLCFGSGFWFGYFQGLIGVYALIMVFVVDFFQVGSG